jgi:hypothetical protein
MKDLFRKEALESFSSSSDIRKGVRAVSIKTAALIFILTVCALLFALWLVFGTIYETVSVNGIIWPSENNGNVYAPAGGKITKTSVSVGDTVNAGDIIAVIPQDDTLRKIKAAKESGADENEIKKLYDEYDSSSVIRSRINGVVTDICEENAYISKGERVAAIVPYDKGDDNKILTAFIPSSSGGLVTHGMAVQVMPDYAPREKYGYIKAFISGISEYPITGQNIKETNSSLFLSSMDENESYLQLEITLLPDSETASHVKWSNPNSSEQSVTMGMLCGADIIIKECRPYQWLF